MTLINFMIIHLFMKLTLVIGISFSHQWSIFIVDQCGIYDSGINSFYNLLPAFSDLKMKVLLQNCVEELSYVKFVLLIEDFLSTY
jgi:hypothetical protein